MTSAFLEAVQARCSAVGPLPAADLFFWTGFAASTTLDSAGAALDDAAGAGASNGISTTAILDCLGAIAVQDVSAGARRERRGAGDARAQKGA